MRGWSGPAWQCGRVAGSPAKSLSRNGFPPCHRPDPLAGWAPPSTRETPISTEPRGMTAQGIRQLPTPGVATFEALAPELANGGAAESFAGVAPVGERALRPVAFVGFQPAGDVDAQLAQPAAQGLP